VVEHLLCKHKALSSKKKNQTNGLEIHGYHILAIHACHYDKEELVVEYLLMDEGENLLLEGCVICYCIVFICLSRKVLL
jgi:hypothetical protein